MIDKHNYYQYQTTYDQVYEGRVIHCCHHRPDILCRIEGQQHGNFFCDTGAAVVSAKERIDRDVAEENKSNGSI